jgi:hypothetical protein
MNRVRNPAWLHSLAFTQFTRSRTFGLAEPIVGFGSKDFQVGIGIHALHALDQPRRRCLFPSLQIGQAVIGNLIPGCPVDLVDLLVAVESLSPEAANTIIPAAVASVAACSMSWPAAAPQLDSSDPHEIVHMSQPSAVAARTALAWDQ